METQDTYTHTWPDGRAKTYQIVNGTYYPENAPGEVVSILETYRGRGEGTRLELDYGDIETGRSWGEIYDTTGYIGRTRGNPISAPLLVYSRRSTGGTIISADCIVRIRTARGKYTLYQHPTYHAAEVTE